MEFAVEFQVKADEAIDQMDAEKPSSFPGTR